MFLPWEEVKWVVTAPLIWVAIASERIDETDSDDNQSHLC